AIAAVLFGGVALDTWGPKVSADPAVRAASAPYEARAVFCPPALGKPASRMTVTTAARGDEPVTVGFEPASDERVELTPGTVLESKPPTARALDVVGYGAPVDASVVTSIDDPISGVGAAGCASEASTRWFFPEGNSTVTHDERLVIYNPFPDEAVVNVSLLTPGGEKSKAGLADRAVPSESSVTLALNDFVLEQKVLGAVVSATRGRVVAWRLTIARPDQLPSGVQFTLGATRTAETWYFPEGAVGTGFRERLSVLNPGTDEAIVNVTLVNDARAVPAAGSTEVQVPPRSSMEIVLDEAALAGERGGAGAIVNSANGVPIVVERTVFYTTQEVDGTASEIGSPSPSLRWLLGPATSRPDTDSVVLLSASADRARVSLTLLRPDGRAVEPERLQDLPLAAGTRLRIPLSEITAGEAYTVVVDSTAPVVAERFSYSGGAGDVASLMGTPLD
ncbi:MAG TPA: DUF5719 family protein, partial [Actinomycetota bacterium]|nr:DUF5719 family protein [Actinomycetota bacterium]